MSTARGDARHVIVEGRGVRGLRAGRAGRRRVVKVEVGAKASMVGAGF